MSQQRTPIVLPSLSNDSRCLARISTRSALFGDLNQLLVSARDQTDYKPLITEHNVCHRRTASARQKLFQELKGRYLLDPDSPCFIAFLNEWRNCSSELDRKLLAYVLFCLHDRTVFLTSTVWLFPLIHSAPKDLSLVDLKGYLLRLSKESHPEIADWSGKTLERVAQHYLASVRDFGFAEGKQKKTSTRPSITAPPTRLLLRLLNLAGVSDKEAISHSAFRIFGIGEGEVYDHLKTLHQQGGLHFRMQGDVIELGGVP